MTDKITKAIAKLSPKERQQVKIILQRLKDHRAQGLKVAKLKGHKGIFRVKKGDLRIIYRRHNQKIRILTIERRSKTTYKDY